MKIPGWIITILLSILTAAVLELNKNTLFGWLLFALAFVGMVITGCKYMGSWKWWKRGLGILAYLLVCAGIIFITWPPVRQVPAADMALSIRTLTSKNRSRRKSEPKVFPFGSLKLFQRFISSVDEGHKDPGPAADAAILCPFSSRVRG